MRRLRHIPALLLAITLALALGFVPNATRLLAAPAQQAGIPNIKGYYQSDVIPGEGDNPALVVGLLLFDDGSARVVSDYQNDTNVINEVGTWVDNGDKTLTLTVTGTIDSAYAAPVGLNFQVDDNGSLVVPGSATGAFGEAGLTLIPTPFGKSETILTKIPSDALAYQSKVLPSTSSAGLQLTLALFEDGSLTLVSDYMNKGDNVVEVGTWTQGDNSTLNISLTGQVEAGNSQVTAYDAPLDFVFTVHEDNSLDLVDKGGALFGPEGLNLIPITATGAVSKDETGEAVAVVEAAASTAAETTEVVTGTVTSEATVEATTEVTQEATVEATTQPTAEVTAEATREVTPEATAEITEEIGKEPVAEVTPEPTKEASTGPSNPEVVGNAGLTETAVMTPTGAYVSSVLPSGDKGGNFLVMVFNEDGSLYFTTYSLNGDRPLVEVGTWSSKGGDSYSASVTGTVDNPYDQPIEVPFTIGKDRVIDIADVSLYPVANISLASAPTLVAKFQSNTITDSVGATQTVMLAFYDDSSAEWSTASQAGEPATKYGNWKVNEAGDTITVTLTHDDKGVLNQPEEWLFDIGSNQTLILRNDNQGVFGAAGLTLTSLDIENQGKLGEGNSAETPAESGNSQNAGVETSEPVTNEVASSEEITSAIESGAEITATEGITSVEELSHTGGMTATAGIQIFQSKVLPAASSPGLQLTLGMQDDGRAAIDYDYMNNENVITNTGTWAENEGGTVTVILTDGPNGKLELPVELTLKLNDEGNWVIVSASEESLGLVNVVLAPVASPK